MADCIRRMYMGFLFLCLFPAASLPQSQYREFEMDLLHTLTRDTASRISAFLPERYSFGVRTPEGGRLLLVKDGSVNRLLLEGTHRVFEVSFTNGSPSVERIDNTFFHGDNFDMIAFFRKDTLHQYGGYGNWKLRDFLTFFRENSKDWEYSRIRGRLLENRWTPFQYNPEEDRLHVLGAVSIDHRDQSISTKDSLFTFDFRLRKWSQGPAIRNEDSILPHTPGMGAVGCSFGKGVLFKHRGALFLADLSTGRYTRIGTGAMKATEDTDSSAWVVGDSSLLLVLSDSIHAFFEKDGRSFHARQTLRFDSLMARSEKSLFDSQSRRKAMDFGMKGILSIAVLAISIFLIQTKAASLKPPTPPAPNGGEPEPDNNAVLELPPSKVLYRSPVEEILIQAREHLTTTEWMLLCRLVETSAEGDTMDAAKANHLLGVSHKGPEIRKSRRNKSFTNINRVFERLGLGGEPLVIHERDEFDKRAFRYLIREDRASTLKKAIDTLHVG